MPTEATKSLRVKTDATKFVQGLPASSTRNDLMHRIYVRQKIEAGLADFESGRVHTPASIQKEFALP
jgi:hypothetical protein